MSVIEISIAAGDILLALERQGGAARLGDIPCAAACSHVVLIMAAGWLVKEGWVTLHAGAGDWIVKARTIDRALRKAGSEPAAALVCS